MPTPLRDLARTERDAYLATLKKLVELESPTADKSANDALAQHLQTVLEAQSWQVERVPKEDVGDQLIARFEAAGETRTLILAHFDTVWPVGTLLTMPLKEEDGKLYGPGVLDMKAGIATAIHAVNLASRAGLELEGPVTLVLTSDEEEGSRHSRDLIEAEAKKHDRVLVLEPGMADGALKKGRKGTGGFKVRFEGVGSHAGNNPKEGASALRELAQFLFFAEDLTDYDAGTTVNLTVAKGGVTSNVIAEEASATLDVRAAKLSEAERVEEALKSYAPRDSRVKIQIEGGVNRPPMEFTEANQTIFAQLKTIMKQEGLELEAQVVGGGSDGNFTSALGIATFDGLGSVGVGLHARNEHIRIDETLDRVALVLGLLTKSTVQE